MSIVREIRLAGAPRAVSGHVCALFADRDEQFEVLLPFIREGFDQGDKAVHIVNGDLRDDHFARLRGGGIDVDRAPRSGQLEVASWDETYLQGGYFDQVRTLRAVQDLLERGRAEGYPATRIVANMEWALEGLPGVHDLVEYEARVHDVLRHYDDPVVCVYDTTRFSGRMLIDIMRTHPVAIVGGVVHENPFYMPPDEFLRELRSGMV
jgi:hypothetical protein